MKWFVAAVLLFFSHNAAAGSMNANFVKAPGNSYAFFKGSFNLEDYLGPANINPMISCLMNFDNATSRCVVTNMPEQFPTQMVFKGQMRVMNDELHVTGAGIFEGTPMILRILCDEKRCYRLQVWETETALGFACDIVAAKPQAKKAPPPPPPNLLDKKAAPYKKEDKEVLSF